jgi:hypothetical protein
MQRRFLIDEVELIQDCRNRSSSRKRLFDVDIQQQQKSTEEIKRFDRHIKAPNLTIY